MRRIDEIVIHCSATNPLHNIGAAEIDEWHKARGWDGIGYHYVIRRNGALELGRPLEKPGAHTYGHNKHSIGVCYVGGLNYYDRPQDNRTPAQKKTLLVLLQALRSVFTDARIVGHRDLSPDVDGDGEVEPWEWLKMCPCFDAKEEYKEV